MSEALTVAAHNDAPDPRCPRCKGVLSVTALPEAHCRHCNWRGQVYRFAPLDFDIQPVERALDEDAVCVHHPQSRATAVCQGTGDYICSLCMVEVKGRQYSIQYVDKVGLDQLDAEARGEIKRPDRLVWSYALLNLITGGMLGFGGSFLFVLTLVAYVQMQHRLGNDEQFKMAGSSWARQITLLAVILSGAVMFFGWFVFYMLVTGAYDR